MRYQIVKMESPMWPEDPPRWSFVAHGARYEEAQALETKRAIEARGVKVMLLPLEGPGND